MGYYWDRFERGSTADIDREESRSAVRRMSGDTTCYQHHHIPNGAGGATCVCGDTLQAGDL